MYEALLALHNLLRWVVLAAALWAVVRAISGWMSQQSWTSTDVTSGKVFTYSITLQLLVGLGLYALSPVTTSAFGNMAIAMQTRDIRFFVAEHLVYMVLAVVAAHIGSARARRATTDMARFKTATIFYGVSLVLIIVGIPWWRPLLRGM